MIFSIHNNSEEHDRQVGFSLRVVPAHDDDEVVTPGALTPEEDDTKQLEEMSSALNNWIETLMDHQDYMRVREATFRDMAEATFTRVFRWSKSYTKLFYLC